MVARSLDVTPATFLAEGNKVPGCPVRSTFGVTSIALAVLSTDVFEVSDSPPPHAVNESKPITNIL